MNEAGSARGRKLTNAATSGVLADLAGFGGPFRLASGTAGPDFASYNVVGGATEGPDDLTGTPDDDHIAGLGGDDGLHGLAGNDLLDGGTGTDILDGGPGDDIYVVDSTADQANESAGNGIDLVYAVVSYQLAPGSEVERLSWIDWTLTTAASLTGNALGNSIAGNAGANLLDGRAGADRMVGFGGDDIYVADNAGDQVIESAGAGNDVIYALTSYQLAPGSEIERLSWIDWTLTTAASLTGNEFNNRIEGNAGANLLDGRVGVDRMTGFGGDDIYIVDNAGDQVVEAANAGNDVIYALVDYQLAQTNSAVERLSAIDWTATTPLRLTGNAGNNRVEGNRGDNWLDGAGGGFDTLVGFEGDDTYIVHNAFAILIETANRGYDTVYLRGGEFYQLAAGVSVERFAMLDTGEDERTTLIGNEFGNLMQGARGINLLDGRGGADVMEGLDGSDTYVVDDLGDQVIETGPAISTGGNDRIYTSVDFHLNDSIFVETLEAIDLTFTDPLSLSGNSLANRISGNNGANLIDGKAGADALRGYGGGDTFAFTTAIGGGNIDSIADFSAADDTIRLDDSVFTGLSPGALPASAFVTGTAAADADDRIVYDGATGRLSFDADGNGAGAAVQFATLEGAPAITASDFTVI